MNKLDIARHLSTFAVRSTAHTLEEALCVPGSALCGKTQENVTKMRKVGRNQIQNEGQFIKGGYEYLVVGVFSSAWCLSLLAIFSFLQTSHQNKIRGLIFG